MQTLIEQLQSYQPSDARDAQGKQAMIDLAMAHCDDMLRRNFYTPGHFTCSGIILNCEGTHVLANFHAKCMAWMHFGGHWERRENSAFMTILHEVAEEVFNYPESLDLPDLSKHGIGSPLGDKIFDVSVGNVIRDTEALHKHFDIRFLLTLPMDSATCMSAESLGLRWMSFEEAQREWTTDSDIDVHRLLLKAQAWARHSLTTTVYDAPSA